MPRVQEPQNTWRTHTLEKLPVTLGDFSLAVLRKNNSFKLLQPYYSGFCYGCMCLCFSISKCTLSLYAHLEIG